MTTHLGPLNSVISLSSASKEFAFLDRIACFHKDNKSEKTYFRCDITITPFYFSDDLNRAVDEERGRISGMFDTKLILNPRATLIHHLVWPIISSFFCNLNVKLTLMSSTKAFYQRSFSAFITSYEDLSCVNLVFKSMRFHSAISTKETCLENDSDADSEDETYQEPQDDLELY